MTGADDDDDWLEGLAGRGNLDSPAHSEGTRLRAALSAVAEAQSQQERGPDDLREDRLLQRARLEGLLRPRSPRRAYRWTALAACFTLAAVGISWYLNPGAPSMVMRSAQGGIARVEVADPAAEQGAFIAALRAAGATVRSYQMLGRFGVDADLTRPISAEVRVRLDSYHVPVPVDGELQIEFVEKRSP